MPKLTLELDVDLYRLLVQAARSNDSSLEDECVRRLEGGVRRSRYVEALLAERGEQGCECGEGEGRGVLGRKGSQDSEAPLLGFTGQVPRQVCLSDAGRSRDCR